ncbi:MAG: transposase [Kiritimatiellales bacterium]
MNSDRLPNRTHPVHYPPIEQFNKPVILFLTVCTARRRKILAQEPVHQALISAWNSAEQWHVGRYVIMPDHIHLFCSPGCHNPENVLSWTTYWKRFVSRACPELKPMWQRHCWDTQLRRDESYTEKWNYILYNPVRAGLTSTPEEWPFHGIIHHLRW